jgi:hypothetical protein
MKRTSLILDTDLLERASTVLGTGKATETVRTALERVVREGHMANLVAWELPDDADDRLDARRRRREFGD